MPIVLTYKCSFLPNSVLVNTCAEMSELFIIFQTDLDQARTLKDRIITAFKVSIFRPPVNLDNFQSQPEEGNHISSLSVNYLMYLFGLTCAY